jgi:hypothetical protein
MHKKEIWLSLKHISTQEDAKEIYFEFLSFILFSMNFRIFKPKIDFKNEKNGA